MTPADHDDPRHGPAEGRLGAGAPNGTRSVPGRAQGTETNVVALRAARSHCRHCPLRPRCVPATLADAGLAAFETLFDTQRRVRRGEVVFHAGTPFESLYVVRVGSLKTCILAEDGREQVAGYQMAGDIIGFDGIAAGRHTCSAAALEDSEVCALPFARLEEIAQVHTTLQHTLRLMLAAEVRRSHTHMLLLGSMRAEERVASFLLNLADRHRRRGYSPSEFVLRMTREEIGSYLGLKLETVSRAFSRLQIDGLIQAQGRDIKLIDPPRLLQMVGRERPESPL